LSLVEHAVTVCDAAGRRCDRGRFDADPWLICCDPRARCNTSSAKICGMLDQLIALAAPPRCAACRLPMKRAEAVLCAACCSALPWLSQTPCCSRCALPLPHSRDRGCRARDAAFDAAWSAVAYEGAARDVLHALKFAAARPLAGVMAQQIAAAAPDELLRYDGASLVAVPPHPARRRSRGFDPAGLLVHALARASRMPVLAALRRSGAGSRQLGASRETRLAGARLGFTARGLAPPHVVLVDDVYTTGATLDACARALRAAGAQRVIAITWARTCDVPTSVETNRCQA